MVKKNNLASCHYLLGHIWIMTWNIIHPWLRLSLVKISAWLWLISTRSAACSWQQSHLQLFTPNHSYSPSLSLCLPHVVFPKVTSPSFDSMWIPTPIQQHFILREHAEGVEVFVISQILVTHSWISLAYGHLFVHKPRCVQIILCSCIESEHQIASRNASNFIAGVLVFIWQNQTLNKKHNSH